MSRRSDSSMKDGVEIKGLDDGLVFSCYPCDAEK